jgi:hypothetical protein
MRRLSEASLFGYLFDNSFGHAPAAVVSLYLDDVTDDFPSLVRIGKTVPDVSDAFRETCRHLARTLSAGGRGTEMTSRL